MTDIEYLEDLVKRVNPYLDIIQKLLDETRTNLNSGNFNAVSQKPIDELRRIVPLLDKLERSSVTIWHTADQLKRDYDSALSNLEWLVKAGKTFKVKTEENEPAKTPEDVLKGLSEADTKLLIQKLMERTGVKNVT